MTEAPDPQGQWPGPQDRGDTSAADGRPGEGTDPPRRRRARRRASRPGTNPSADEAPDVLAPREAPAPGESQHDRWLREQRPPHWE